MDWTIRRTPLLGKGLLRSSACPRFNFPLTDSFALLEHGSSWVKTARDLLILVSAHCWGFRIYFRAEVAEGDEWFGV